MFYYYLIYIYLNICKTLDFIIYNPVDNFIPIYIFNIYNKIVKRDQRHPRNL